MARLIVFIAALVAMFALAGIASAADWPNGTLDQVATQVAQHPVHVYCEDDYTEWRLFENAFDVDLNGFTFPLGGNVYPFAPNTLYLGPEVCGTLHVLVQYGVGDAGPYWAGLAVLTLVHEASHQRLRSLDEALTECTALKLVPSVLSSFVAPTVTVKRGRRNVTIANWYFTRTLGWVQAWDAAEPAQYHGATC
jgi:hypothetical protein